MSEPDAAAQAAAAQLLKQYGDDAEVIATLRAAEVAALGDADALDHWDRVIALLSDEPGTQPVN